MYPQLTALGRAIETYEGMDPTCNNPMALRWSPYENGQKCYPGKGCFASFTTHAGGFSAGMHQLLIVCNGTSPAYNQAARHLGLPDSSYLTLRQFMRIFSPTSDHNIPDKYSAWLSTETGIPVDAQMRSLLTEPVDLSTNS